MEQKIFAIFCYDFDGNLISFLSPAQAPVEGLYARSEPMCYADLRKRGTVIKDYLAEKQIDFMGYRFTFDAHMVLTKIEAIIIKQVYP